MMFKAVSKLFLGCSCILLRVVARAFLYSCYVVLGGCYNVQSGF